MLNQMKGGGVKDIYDARDSCLFSVLLSSQVQIKYQNIAQTRQDTFNTDMQTAVEIVNKLLRPGPHLGPICTYESPVRLLLVYCLNGLLV